MHQNLIRARDLWNPHVPSAIKQLNGLRLTYAVTFVMCGITRNVWVCQTEFMKDSGMWAGNVCNAEYQTLPQACLTLPDVKRQIPSLCWVTTPESEISFTFPQATSSPNRTPQGDDQRKRKDLPLRSVVVNCQSVKTSGKPAQLNNLITSLQADVIIGYESWLNTSIRSSEVFPDSFNCYRRDRPKGNGGGIFILVSKIYESSESEEL